MSHPRVKDTYNKLNSLYKTPAARLGMGSPASQTRSYKKVIELIEKHISLNGLTVHDAGCGHGGIIPHLTKRGIKSYIGSDFITATLREAVERNPDADGFVEIDLVTDKLPRADVTLLLGVLAFHTPEDTIAILRKAIESSKVAVVFYCWWDVSPNIAIKPEVDKMNKDVLDLISESGLRYDTYRFETDGNDKAFILLK